MNTAQELAGKLAHDRFWAHMCDAILAEAEGDTAKARKSLEEAGTTLDEIDQLKDAG